MSNDNIFDERGADTTARRGVSELAAAVLSVLSDAAGPASPKMHADIVKRLVTCTLASGHFSAEDLLASLEEDHLTPDEIVDYYIPEAARTLGTMWVEDEIGFAKVTIATARLQGLLTLLAPPWIRPDDGPLSNAGALMILSANDNHTLGPHVATAQLRRLGASVRILFGPDTASVLRILSEERYDLVLFSCSRTDSLERVGQMVDKIREKMDQPPPIVLGGLVVEFGERVKESTGVDLVTTDVKVASRLCNLYKKSLEASDR